MKRSRKVSDPTTALAKRPLIEVVPNMEPLIPTHSLAQIHRCYHHGSKDECLKPSPSTILSTWFSNLNNVYIALHDFSPQEDGDLKLIKGDLVELINDSSNWWIVKKCNQEIGAVPSNYLGHVFLRSWFYGKMTRNESESLLKVRSLKEENFLIRESETRNNYLTLSLRVNHDQGEQLRQLEQLRHQSNQLEDESNRLEDESNRLEDESNQLEETVNEEDQVNKSLLNEVDGHNNENVELISGQLINEDAPLIEDATITNDDTSLISSPNEPIIKHYLIHCTVNGIFYIHPEVSFNSLDDLVIFYANQKHCLRCKLNLGTSS